jgi:hypothetical protein
VTRRHAPLLRLAAIVAGMALGAAAGAVAAVAGVDLMTDGPGCEPDDAVGCGMSVLFGTVAIGIPFGAVTGAMLAHRLAAAR